MFEASAEVKRGAPAGNQNAAKDKENNCRNPSIESQSVRAESNGVSHYTQRKPDRLAKDRPDLLAMVRFNQMSVNKAAIESSNITGRLSKCEPATDLQTQKTRT